MFWSMDAQTDDAVWEQIINLEVKSSSNFLHFDLMKSHILTIYPIPSALSPAIYQFSAPLMSICTHGLLYIFNNFPTNAHTIGFGDYTDLLRW